ncbi:MAG: hypothetical protein IJ228_13025 [Succinivibrio sp.]|nr:hypothetical protein [Succinivibrio sp.]
MSNNFEPAPGEVQGFWSSQAPTDRQCESRSEALNGAQLLLEITKLLSGKELDLDQVQPANLDEVHRREALEAREQIQSRQRKLPSPPPPPIRAEDAGEAFARYCDAAGDEQAKAAGQAFLEQLTEDNKPASLLIVTGGGARFDRHGYSTQLLEAYRQLYPERAEQKPGVQVKLDELYDLRHPPFSKGQTFFEQSRQRYQDLVHSGLVVIEELCDQEQGLSARAQEGLLEFLDDYEDTHSPLVLCADIPFDRLKASLGPYCFDKLHAFREPLLALLKGTAAPKWGEVSAGS